MKNWSACQGMRPARRSEEGRAKCSYGSCGTVTGMMGRKARQSRRWTPGGCCAARTWLRSVVQAPNCAIGRGQARLTGGAGNQSTRCRSVVTCAGAARADPPHIVASAHRCAGGKVARGGNNHAHNGRRLPRLYADHVSSCCVIS